MTYSRDLLASYFDRLGEGEWNRFDVSGLGAVTLHVHQHYLRRFVPRGARVLEVGAGPGRYTETLHQLGCRVVVADISETQLALNRRYGAERGFASSVEAHDRLDISDLSPLAGSSFDVVVAYGGPLSYVFERREDAVASCRRVLRPGGILLASVMSLWGTLHRHLAVLRDLPLANTRVIVDTGDLTHQTEPSRDHCCHRYRAAELRGLLERHGFMVRAMAASNALATNLEPLLADLRNVPEQWEALLGYEIEATAQPGFLDGGTHLIIAAETTT